MNTLHKWSTRLLSVAATCLFGASGIAMAGDIAEYANEDWLMGGYIWGTTEVVGSVPVDPDGAGCADNLFSVQADDPPWTFAVGPDGAVLTVVDSWALTEQYTIYDRGALIGQTSYPPLDTGCDNDPDFCLTTEASKGFFDMAEGEHSITMTAEVIDNTFLAGCVYFRVDGDVFGGGGSEVEVDLYLQARKVRLDESALIPLAILSSSEFDARQVIPASVQFGPADASPVAGLTRFRDLNKDGYKDLYLRFVATETGIQSGDTEATLSGTWDSAEGEVPIIGTVEFVTRNK